MSMLSRNILISMCAASIITALVINGIIRYKEPTHNTDEIENAHIAFKNATYDYIAARNHAAQISEDTLKKDKKVGPNDPCPCGSGLKYKKCHGKPY